jgi:hypothetical protein
VDGFVVDGEGNGSVAVGELPLLPEFPVALLHATSDEILKLLDSVKSAH